MGGGWKMVNTLMKTVDRRHRREVPRSPRVYMNENIIDRFPKERGNREKTRRFGGGFDFLCMRTFEKILIFCLC